MPVVTIVVPPGAPDLESLLRRASDAVAAALGLADGDVIAMANTAMAVGSGGGGSVLPWLVITVHGTDRGAERVEAALAAAERAAEEWARLVALPLGGVWTEWTLPRVIA